MCTGDWLSIGIKIDLSPKNVLKDTYRQVKDVLGCSMDKLKWYLLYLFHPLCDLCHRIFSSVE